MLSRGDFPGSPEWTQYNHKGPNKREDRSEKERGDDGSDDGCPLMLEKGARSQGTQVPLQAGEGSPLEPEGTRRNRKEPEGTSRADTFVLVRDSFWTSDLQDCKEIHLCCFKPLSLWSFVTAAIGLIHYLIHLKN